MQKYVFEQELEGKTLEIDNDTLPLYTLSTLIKDISKLQVKQCRQEMLEEQRSEQVLTKKQMEDGAIRPLYRFIE